ncbi:MAG: hypothetical protein SGI89_05185 [bacterium]|nr:hypothetical protein [bacterium]
MSSIYKIIFVMLIITFTSCAEKPTESGLPDLSSADKIMITYKADFDSSGKMNLKSVDITDVNELTAIEQTISDEPFPYLYCISSGTMTFYKDSSALITVVFNTEKDYRHVAYNYNNKLTALKLSEESAKLLDKFKN